MVPDFFPFPGLRYDLGVHPASLGDLTAPPYDVIDSEARARLESRHPNNAVHLILPRDGDGGDPYRAAAGTFARWRAGGILAADPARFYVYRMGFVDGTGTERRMLGVVGALRVSDPGNGAVLPHERTMPKPRSDRLNLLRAVAANLDPVWCLTLSGGLSALLEPAGVPAASCVDEDGVRHCLFPVADEAVASRIAAVVASAPAVIADGHHRYETALAYRDEQRATRGGDAGDAEFIMALVVELAEDQLWVQAIHRLLGEGGAGLRDRVAPYASVTAAGDNSPEGVRSLLRTMDQEGCLGLADRDGLWLMTPDTEVLAPDLEQLAGPVRDVDATVADVILAATDTPAPEEYPYDPVEAATAVAKRGAGAAVLLRPPSIAQIAAVAHAGERMPEKTTFFRPKPLTGLVFRALEG